ncbi:MAG: DUF3540 domain-containing protein [Myxococcales bacterium]|nr:DUF3540 domain-containing protein [Myxococcales bacterium]MCB9712702.1 DUF3540 domain-containing protein [Myxococcales bacterium]
MHAHDLQNVTPLPARAPAIAGAIATVVGSEPDGRWRLEGGGRARVAASCLLCPEPGDRVWVVGEPGEGWVLAVLERAQPGPATLSVPGDLRLRTEGRLSLDAAQGLDLSTPADLRVSSDGLQVQAGSAKVVLRELSVLARRVFASLAEVTRVGRVLELLVERVTQRSQHSVRAIEGVDATRAGTLDLRAEGRANIQATHALVNGKELVKMDGGQIHLG